MLPNGGNQSCGIACMGGGGHHSVLLGEDNAKLRPSTVQAVCAIGTAPHLVAVALSPRVLRPYNSLDLCGVGNPAFVLHNLWRGSPIEPLLKEELFAIPLASLQHKLSHLGKRLGRDKQSPTTCIISLWRLRPMELLNAEGSEEFFVELVHKFLARHTAHNHRQQIGVQ